jgi:hypothetical protein
MVGPKPHQPLDKADVGADRCVEPNPRLVLHQLHWQWRPRIFWRRRLGRSGRHGLRRSLRAAGLRLFLGAVGELCFRRLFGPIGEKGALRFSARRQICRRHAPRLRPLQIGEHGTARVFGNGSDLIRQRTETESVQAERRNHSPIDGHEVLRADGQSRMPRDQCGTRAALRPAVVTRK